MTQVGFVGLGTMGSGIARRLLDAGHDVTGWNRTRAKAEPLIAAGMRWADSPRAVAEASDVVFTMVTNTQALHAVTGGDDGILAGLGDGKVYVDMSTVSPAASRALAEAVAARGAKMLDAPVSGSVITLEKGKLSIMVGGDADAVERVDPVLRAIGPVVTHVGGNGQAVLMKIAVNLNLAVQMLGFSEGVLLAEKGGIERKTAVDVMLRSVIASPMVEYRGPFVLEQPDEAWFDCSMMQKDVQLALELARTEAVPMPTTAATNEMLTAARGMGLGRHDFAVMFQALARMAGADADVRGGSDA
jgi:3-hydroxyisobutyrate dehydrogenase-like beta-hydroxyacid dehydrogenase